MKRKHKTYLPDNTLAAEMREMGDIVRDIPESAVLAEWELNVLEDIRHAALRLADIAEAALSEFDKGGNT